MQASVMPVPVELSAVEMPDIRPYLSDDQRLGELYGNDIYKETWDWLNRWKCAHLIHTQLLEQYSMAMARYIQMERLISEYGFVSKHPTTGAPITSPMVSIAQAYSRQANVLWQEIYCPTGRSARWAWRCTPCSAPSSFPPPGKAGCCRG